MSSHDLYVDGFPHGTPEGYDQGCRGGSCPTAIEIGLSCRTAKHLNAGDHQYRTLHTAGHTPTEIATALGLHHPPALHRPLQSAATTPTPHKTPHRAIREEPAAAPTRPSQDERMPHPTPPTRKEPTMPTTTPPTITTERWTAGLTNYAKTRKLTEIRNWLNTHGHPVSTHGQIPTTALTAYAEAEAAGTLHTTPTTLHVGQHGLNDRQALADDADQALHDLHTTPTPIANPAPTSSSPPPRPEWADITIPEDIRTLTHERDQARRIAIALEQELAHTETELDTAHNALHTTLTAWNTTKTTLNRLADACETLHTELQTTRATLHTRIDAHNHANATIRTLTTQLHTTEHALEQAELRATHAETRTWWQKLLNR